MLAMTETKNEVKTSMPAHLLSVASIGVAVSILSKKDLRKSTFFDKFFIFYVLLNNICLSFGKYSYFLANFIFIV